MNNGQMLEELEVAVAAPAFLRVLSDCTKRALARRPQDIELERQALSHSFHAIHGQQGSSANGAPAPPAPAATCGGDFIVVEKDDAVDALAYYIAVCISQSPEAQGMTPKELQVALTVTLKSLKKSRFKRFCTVGRYAYRFGALTCSALQMWQNPWLVQAVLAALCAVGRAAIFRLI